MLFYLIMTIKIEEKDNISTVYLEEKLDKNESEKIKELIFPFVEAEKEVHLNLEKVQYIDSSGIANIIEMHQFALKKNTKIVLKKINKIVSAEINKCKLDEILYF